jgi:hypothetical protein
MIVFAGFALAAVLGSPEARAQRILALHPDPWAEVSALGAFSKTDYGNGTYSTSRHYTGEIGWNILPVTELEVSYSYSNNFFNSDPVQTTSSTDQTLGASVVQSLMPPHSFLELYVKGGAGQYNRTQTGTINGIPTKTVESKSPSGILGGGIRIHLTRGFELKAEGTAYLPNFNISGALNNFTVQGGLGWQFY